MNQPMSVLTSQATQDRYTPPNIINRARKCMGDIDLDPASADMPQRWIQAWYYHTLERPATKPWFGRVWLNPPFNDATKWVDNLVQRYTCGDIEQAVLLVNSALGYKWFEELWRLVPVVCLRDRVCFIAANGVQSPTAAKKGQTIAYFGLNYRGFIDCFGDLGRLLIP